MPDSFIIISGFFLCFYLVFLAKKIVKTFGLYEVREANFVKKRIYQAPKKRLDFLKKIGTYQQIVRIKTAVWIGSNFSINS